MTISMDKKYRTRGGRDVRLLCVDAPGSHPVVGLIDGKTGADSWTPSGYWVVDDDQDCDDLIEYHEPDIRTIWVNVYKDGVMSYANATQAESASGVYGEPLAIAQPVTFEVKHS